MGPHRDRLPVMIMAEFTQPEEDRLKAQWQRIRGRLRDEFGEAAFRSWLKSLSLVDLVDGELRIAVPTRFLRDWVLAHYADRIRALWMTENAEVTAIDVIVGERSWSSNADDEMPAPNASRSTPANLAEADSAPQHATGSRASNGEATRLAVDPAEDRQVSAPLGPRFTFQNFVIGTLNGLAHDASR